MQLPHRPDPPKKKSKFELSWGCNVLLALGCIILVFITGWALKGLLTGIVSAVAMFFACAAIAFYFFLKNADELDE